jgi:hypothetical protein
MMDLRKGQQQYEQFYKTQKLISDVDGDIKDKQTELRTLQQKREKGGLSAEEASAQKADEHKVNDEIRLLRKRKAELEKGPQGGKEFKPPAPTKVEPPAEAISLLKQDPSEQNKKYFDEQFGKGAAAKALK